MASECNFERSQQPKEVGIPPSQIVPGTPSQMLPQGSAAFVRHVLSPKTMLELCHVAQDFRRLQVLEARF